MKYTIITIGGRGSYISRIRKTIDFEEILDIPFINGMKEDMQKILEDNNLRLEWNPKRGELGIWLSVVNCWKWCIENNESLMVFEDDAIPQKALNTRVPEAMQELPEDWHFFTLWTPQNQYRDYSYDRVFNDDGTWYNRGTDLRGNHSLHHFGAEYIATAYQGYGGVATIYSPAGAERLLEETRRQGIYTPIDCFLFQQSQRDLVNGFAFKPKYANVVKYDWPTTSIHTTEIYQGE